MLRVIMLPGLGDIHWCMLKLEALLKRKGEQTAKIGIWSPERPRAIEYVKSIPFVSEAEYINAPSWRYGEIWDKLTKRQNYDYAPADDYPGWDCFLGFNGSLSAGVNIKDILPSLAINWNYPILDKEAKYGDDFKNQHGEYCLVFHADHGCHKDWPFTVAQSIKAAKSVGLKPILTGASWDTGVTGDCESITGKTTVPQMLAIIRRASLFIGYAAGNGILATHFKVPTVLLWGPPYKKEFYYSWAESNKGTYQAISTATGTELHQAVKYVLRQKNGPREWSRIREPSDWRTMRGTNVGN